MEVGNADWARQFLMLTVCNVAIGDNAELMSLT
jgi:hypothetical protein